MTGFTSYSGVYEVGELKSGDRGLVSAATGGVGSNLGHLANIKGAQAFGLASTDEKCALLTFKLGYFGAINYTKENISERIDHYFPEGIDVYFDNIGGAILDIALTKLRRYTRVVFCGRISQLRIATTQLTPFTIGAKSEEHAPKCKAFSFMIMKRIFLRQSEKWRNGSKQGN